MNSLRLREQLWISRSQSELASPEKSINASFILLQYITLKLLAFRCGNIKSWVWLKFKHRWNVVIIIGMKNAEKLLYRTFTHLAWAVVWTKRTALFFTCETVNVSSLCSALSRPFSSTVSWPLPGGCRSCSRRFSDWVSESLTDRSAGSRGVTPPIATRNEPLMWRDGAWMFA